MNSIQSIPPDTFGQEENPRPLQDVILDDETLDQLFLDLRYDAQIHEIVITGESGRGTVGHNTTDLARARSALTPGSALTVDVRYRYHDSEWWDSLKRNGKGVRLIRFERRRRR